MTIELAAGEQRQLDVALIPTAGAAELVIERFFVLNMGWKVDGDFYAHCHIRNVGGTAVSGHLNLKGEIYINKGQLIREVDEHADFTVAPGELYDYAYSWGSFRDDPAWLEVFIDGQLVTPRLNFLIGYALSSSDPEVEVVCTDVGNDYAILRYAQHSNCTDWRVSARTPVAGPIEHKVSYPWLRSSSARTSLYHIVMPLLSRRNYLGHMEGRSGGAAHREDYCKFATP